MTRSYSGVSFRLTVEILRPFYPRCPGGRAASAWLGAANAALAAREGAGRGSVGAPGRLSGGGRDARGVDPPAPCGQGGRPRAVSPRAARNVERPGAAPT